MTPNQNLMTTTERNEKLAELGRIVLAACGRVAIENGYGHSADDLVEVGRSALIHGDINPDGTLN